MVKLDGEIKLCHAVAAFYSFLFGSLEMQKPNILKGVGISQKRSKMLFGKIAIVKVLSSGTCVM